jgi:hypothetical protein
MRSGPTGRIVRLARDDLIDCTMHPDCSGKLDAFVLHRFAIRDPLEHYLRAPAGRS